MKVIKMQAYGNDYCLIEHKPNLDYEKLAIKICNRNLGVGGKGLIVVKIMPYLEMFLYDFSGKRQSMDTNALMCFSKYVVENDLIRKKSFDVICSNTKYNITVDNDGYILNLGTPNYNNSMLHISDSISSFGRALKLSDGNLVTIYSLYLGDIETIVIVDNFNDSIINKKDMIINNILFKNKTNVHFVKIIDKGNIIIKSYDKFGNYIKSSLGGAASALQALNKLKLTFKKINVEFELGNIKVELIKDKALICGNSHKVFECEYKEED